MDINHGCRFVTAWVGIRYSGILAEVARGPEVDTAGGVSWLGVARLGFSCRGASICFRITLNSQPPTVVAASESRGGPRGMALQEDLLLQHPLLLVQTLHLKPVLNLRTTTSQKCEAVPRRARI